MRWLGLLWWCFSTLLWAADASPTVAFYLGQNPPLMDLRAFDIVVVDPANVDNPTTHIKQQGLRHQLFARLDLGEVSPKHPYQSTLPSECFLDAEAGRTRRVIDQSCAEWTGFFLDKVVAPLWQRGWRGFYLDNLARYVQKLPDADDREKQRQGLVAVIRGFKKRYPDAQLMLHRGFDLLPDVSGLTMAVVAESLFEGRVGAQPYVEISATLRTALLSQLQQVRDTYHLPVVVVDFVDPYSPNARQRARDIAHKIMELGFTPWVADADLASIGISRIEMIPRRILVVLEAKQSENNKPQDLMETEPHRFLGIMFAQLGLSYEFVDLNNNGKLPEDVLVGRYAGVVTWFLGGQDHPEFGPWMRRHVQAGMRFAMFGSMGFTPDEETAQALGVRPVEVGSLGKLEIIQRDSSIMDFEVKAVASPSQLVPLMLTDEGVKQGKILIRLRDQQHGTLFDGAALTAWGGFVWTPYEIIELRMNDQTNWVVNPLKFLRATLKLSPDIPVPDATTEGGRRSLLIHIDGDGFPSKLEMRSPWPDIEVAYGADIILRSFLEHYKLPTAMSIIESETSPLGRFPDISARLEGIARKMMYLPFIEGASHSYTHPLVWNAEVQKDIKRKQNGENDSRLHDARPEDFDEENTHSISIEGYEFGLTREIKESIDYINKRLMPPGKKVKVMLWTGDCMPPFEALDETYKQGFFNMNGGDTLITERNNSWTMIASQSLRKKGALQIHAPHQNENVYTNDWEGPFYGFERVVQTFKLTDTKIRFKPVNIYYHTYAGTKAGSIYGLKAAYDWVVSRPLTHLYPSEYIQKVLDFEQTTVSRDLSSGDLVVRTGDHLRTLRVAGNQPFAKWSGSPGVVGVTQYAAATGEPEFEVTYLMLASGETRLLAKADGQTWPYLAEANGTAGNLVRTMNDKQRELRFSLDFAANDHKVVFTLAQAKGCQVRVDGRPLSPVSSERSIYAAHHRQEDRKANTMTPILRQTEYLQFEPKKNGQPDYLPTRYQVQVLCPR